jgi:hypothetical protein
MKLIRESVAVWLSVTGWVAEACVTDGMQTSPICKAAHPRRRGDRSSKRVSTGRDSEGTALRLPNRASGRPLRRIPFRLNVPTVLSLSEETFTEAGAD